MATGAARPDDSPFLVTRRPDGIILVDWTVPAKVTLDDAISIMDQVDRLSGGVPAALLVNVGATQGMERESRSHFQKAGNLKATALLVGSPVSRVIANLFIGLNRPAYPIQLFTSEAEAVQWLHGYMG